MDATRERISRIKELREILLSFHTSSNLVTAAVVCAILAWNPRQIQPSPGTIGGTAKAHSPLRLTASKAFAKSTETAGRPMFCSRVSPYLPQHEGHVSGPSVGPEPTLSFWCVFLCYRRYEPSKQDVRRECACNGK